MGGREEEWRKQREEDVTKGYKQDTTTWSGKDAPPRIDWFTHLLFHESKTLFWNGSISMCELNQRMQDLQMEAELAQSPFSSTVTVSTRTAEEKPKVCAF